MGRIDDARGIVNRSGLAPAQPSLPGFFGIESATVGRHSYSHFLSEHRL